MLDMKRREFIALVGGGGLLLAAKVRRARAPQPAVPMIGFLNGQSPGEYAPMAAAFDQGLSEIGFVEYCRKDFGPANWAKADIDQIAVTNR